MIHQNRLPLDVTPPWPKAEYGHSKRYVIYLLVGLWLAKIVRDVPWIGTWCGSGIVAYQFLLPLHRIDHYQMTESQIGLDGQGWRRELGRGLMYSLGWLGALECLGAIIQQIWPSWGMQPLPSSLPTLPQSLTLVISMLYQLLAVALPEETMFRGYLRTLWPAPRPSTSGWQRWVPLALDRHALTLSLLFALSHWVGEWHVGRLLTFFPSLVFFRLFDAHHRLLAPILFHATCNVWVAARM